MEETNQVKQKIILSPEEMQLKILKWKKRVFFFDCILLIVFLCVGYYVVTHVQEIDIAQDPCGVCMAHTNSTCVIGLPKVATENKIASYKINFTGLH